MKTYLLVLVAILLASSNVFALGVSPPRIILEDLPKDYSIERLVTLTGVEAGSTVTTSFSGEGSQWVEAKLGSSFVAESDLDIIFPFVLDIPQKAPNGDYDVAAQIVVTAPKDEEIEAANVATVSSGVLVNVQFSISGDEVVKYRISSVTIPTLEDKNPILAVININNEGNIYVQPKSLELKIKDKEKNLLHSVSTTDATKVEPYTNDHSIASFSLDIEPGFYFGDITIDMGDGTNKFEDIPFDIVEAGSFKANGELVKIEIQDNIEKIARIDGFFRNTGQIGLHSRLIGEVYKGGTLVDIFESSREYVEIGETKQFIHYYNVLDKGNYTLKTRVEFLGKNTQTLETSFSVSKSDGSSSSLEVEDYMVLLRSVVAIVAFIILILIILGICVIRIRKRKKK